MQRCLHSQYLQEEPLLSHCWQCWRHCGSRQDQSELGTEQPLAAGLPQKGRGNSFNCCSHSSFLLETRGLWLVLQVPSPETALLIPIHLLWGQKEPHNEETPQTCQGITGSKLTPPLASCTLCSGVPVTPRCAPGAAGSPLPAWVPGSGCCWEQQDHGSLAGYLLVTTGETEGEKMNVPEDSHTAVPSPSKAEPGGRAGQGAVAHGHS